MNVYDTWTKKQRIRVRIAAIAFGAQVVLFLAIAVGSFFAAKGMRRLLADDPFFDTRLMLTIFAVPALVMLLMFVFGVVAWRGLRREQRALRLVPAHDGLVCPRCRIVAECKGETGSCPRCRARWPRAELARYWDQYVVASAPAQQWAQAFRARYHAGRLDPVRQFMINVRNRPRYGVLYALGVGVLCPLPFLLLGAVSILDAGIWFAIGFTFLCGMSLLASGGRHVGEAWHCAACGYEKQPDAPDVCAECGAKWDRPGSLRLGTIQSRPHLQLAGVFLIAIVAALFLTTAYKGKQWFLAIVPTPLLVDAAARVGGADAWGTLAARDLTPGAEGRLARTLLDRRSSTGFLDADSRAWLMPRIKNGSLPQDIVDDFYREMLVVEDVGPRRAIRGETCDLAIDVESLQTPNTPGGLFVLVESVTVDGKTRRARTRDAVHVWQMKASGLLTFRLKSPLLAVTPERAGNVPVTVTLACWYADKTWSGDVRETADDVPGLKWTGRIEIEHELVVTE